MLVSMLLRRLAITTPAEDRRSDCERWFADPLSHPDVRRMDTRQLGDLPIGRLRLDPDAACGCCDWR